MPRLLVTAAATAIVVLVGLVVLVALPGTTDAGFRGVILGAVIAGVVSLGGEWLRIQHESQLDATKRRDNRRIDSNRFQMENLLALQDDLFEMLVKSDAQARITAGARAHVRVERVLDAELRSQVNSLLSNNAVASTEEAEQAVEKEYVRVHDNLGAVLRKYLAPPDE